MSIRRATKLTKFLTYAGLSLLLSFLFLSLSKKEEKNYLSLLDFETDSVSADVAVPPTTGDGGSADGNDSGSGDGDF